jgi:acetyl-CoA acetyltransferase
VVEAGKQAFAEAGRSPAEVDVAEVYGVFGATELILYEDLGFCEKGKASQFLADGRSTHGGDLVINPTGGRMSLGHPAGATPLYEVAEVVRQLRGDALGTQVQGARVGLVHAEHGMMNGSVVCIFEGRG